MMNSEKNKSKFLTLFIYPDIEHFFKGYRGRFSHGIGSLSAFLKKSGFPVGLFHVKEDLSRNAFLERVFSFEPRLIGFSFSTNKLPFVKKWARWIRQESSLPTICGGPHTMVAPASTLSLEGVDMICLGEGEEILLELCEKMDTGIDFQKIPGLWLKKDGHMLRNPVRPLREDLDSFPFPDRELFDYDSLDERREEWINFMATRGCAYKCPYCCNHCIKELYPNKEKYVRYRSVGNLLAEMEEVLKKYPWVRYVIFDDDTLTTRGAWFEELAREYPKRIGLPFLCNSRVDHMTPELASTLKRAGCVRVNMGIESGDARVRKKILGRNVEDQKIISAFRSCSREGVATFSFNMVGLPSEGPADILKTIKLNARIPTDFQQISVFYPYPGTDLFDLCEKKGFLTDRDSISYFSEATTLRLPRLSPGTIRVLFRFFTPLKKRYQTLFQRGTLLSRIKIRLLDLGVLLAVRAPGRFKERFLRRLAPPEDEQS